MECIIQYLKANYPEAKFTGGLPDVPAKPTPSKAAAPTRPISTKIPASKPIAKVEPAVEKAKKEENDFMDFDDEESDQKTSSQPPPD